MNANCRLRRIYFSDRLYSDAELPAEYKLYVPIGTKPTKHVEEKKKSELRGSKVIHDEKEKEGEDEEGEREAIHKTPQSQSK